MATPVGATERGYSCCPEYSEIFPSDTFDLGRSVTNRLQTDAAQVRPRWFGHYLSGEPDSGIGRSEDGRVTIACAGLAKVHSDRLSHSRSDANAGLVNEKLLLWTTDWMGFSKGQCGVCRVCVPFLVWNIV